MDQLYKTTAEKHKRHAALTSVAAAVVITGFKIVVGLATGSLGILAEAAHSGFDFLAALMTYFAVRIADKPADSEHPYGHGKVENLSALFETLLLLITCVWIVYEAVERLFYRPVTVDASVWAFIVMISSVVIDFSRSRVLYHAAKKYNSQALEADALHFSTDIWSSAVVVLGLLCVLVADRYPNLEFLHRADAVAALGVAVIVIVVSVRLGIRTIQALIDAAPEGMDAVIKREVESLEGIANCHNIRLRSSGPRLFIDVHVLMDGNLTLAQAHALTEVIEETIKNIHPESDVVVHPEPLQE
jgi:cation diffusion facilitator family transporter